MSPLVVTILTWIALLGAGLIAGTFFTFSSFVMPALSARPAAESIRAMQTINVKVLNVSFLGTFFGTALASLAVAVQGVTGGGAPSGLALLLGGGLYVVGTFGVTVACNVPRNEALARADPDGPDAATTWSTYDREWTAWNTIRALAALAAMAAFVAALLLA